jgi:hypothetical protein
MGRRVSGNCEAVAGFHCDCAVAGLLRLPFVVVEPNIFFATNFLARGSIFTAFRRVSTWLPEASFSLFSRMSQTPLAEPETPEKKMPF